MENPEKLETLGTQDTGRRQTKHNTETKKNNTEPLKTAGELRCSRTCTYLGHSGLYKM